MAGVVVSGAAPLLTAGATRGGEPADAANRSLKFDFGVGGAEQKAVPGYEAVGPGDTFTAERGWGWLQTEGLNARDRDGAGPLKRDFVFGAKAQTFRITGLPLGLYRLTVVAGDLTFGNHVTHVSLKGAVRSDGRGIPLQSLGNPPLKIDGYDGRPKPPGEIATLRPALAEFDTLTATIAIPEEGTPLDIVFDSPENNWIVNALTVEPATEVIKVARITQERVPVPSDWGPVLTWPDPTAALLAGHRKRAEKTPKAFKATGLKRADYLHLIAGEIDFWKTQQDQKTGAIIDPYKKIEWQYSTPAFAHAASALVAYADRKDLIEPAAKALDWSAHTLSTRTAATGHEDFFAPMLAHAIRLLKPYVPAERSGVWENDIRRFDPFTTYRAGVGRGGNWNVVAASGEALFHKMGLRDAKNTFAEASFAGQGAVFGTPYGLYLEGPMPYDHFPRLWAGDLIARGYRGPYYRELTEVLRRASITSLFMQSPSGELPAGGRSAHHQWNEAEQCVTYEIYSARALLNGDNELASYYKRAAHLALQSMRRWVRPSGEMQIVKNWVDPSKGHAFEGYSAHSQYNLLPMSMLATAFEHAETTQNVAEKPSPADVGGYVLQIEALHKIFANCGGAYAEIDTSGDHHYDATGLIRVHFAGISPQLGPSDSVLAHPVYRIPAGSPVPLTTGIGVAWQGTDSAWHTLGELVKADIKTVGVETTEATTGRVAFRVRYEGNLHGLTAIEERFVLTPGQVEVTTVLPGYAGPVRRIIPILADDGRTKTVIDASGNRITVSQPGRAGTGSPTFTAVGTSALTLGAELYPNHNGWARLAVGEYPAGSGERGIRLIITGR